MPERGWSELTKVAGRVRKSGKDSGPTGPRKTSNVLRKRVELRLRKAAMLAVKGVATRNADTAVLESLDIANAKVLFLRQNMIGDALISTPVFAALKRSYPQMKIDVVVDRRNASVFEHDCIIRRRHCIPKGRPAEIIRLLKRLRAERYDIIVDLIHSPSSTSTTICWLSKPQITAGPARSNDYVYDITLPALSEADPQTRMMRRLAQCLSVFGLDPEREVLEPYFSLPQGAIDFASNMAARVRGADPSRRLIGLNLSGSKPEKYWGRENFIALINMLSRKMPGERIVLLNDRRYAEDAAVIAEATVAELSGETRTLHDFAACIRELDLLVTPDSAAVHFADIFDVPVVDLVVDPEDVTLWLPSNVRFEALHARKHDLRSISVESVANAVIDLAHSGLSTPVITIGTAANEEVAHTETERSAAPAA